MLVTEKAIKALVAAGGTAVDDESVWSYAQTRGVLPTTRQDVLMRFYAAPAPFPDFFDKLATDAPHLFPFVPPDESEALKPLIEAACGSAPTMKARAALRAAAGPELYLTILEKFGCNERTLAPGTNPRRVTDETEKKTEQRKPDASNPFSKAGWNLTQQSRLVTAIGFEKASQIANAAGVKIGATKPVM
jgi:hypothetical protein